MKRGELLRMIRTDELDSVAHILAGIIKMEGCTNVTFDGQYVIVDDDGKYDYYQIDTKDHFYLCMMLEFAKKYDIVRLASTDNGLALTVTILVDGEEMPMTIMIDRPAGYTQKI